MNRREAILKAALESFEESGTVAIEDVQRRSGASIGSIYHHFGGRQEIAAALYIEVLREYQAGVTRALARAGGAEEGVKAMVRHHLRWVQRHPVRARYLLQGGALRKGIEDQLGELNRELSTAVESWVETHSSIRSLPMEAFYAIVIGPAQELSRLWLAGRVPSLRKLEDELSSAAWRGVRAS